MAALLDALWGDRPPKTGAGTVRTYVSRLRQLLNAGDPAARIAIEPIGDGYALRGEHIRVDIEQFEKRVAAASAARGRAEALELCRAALAQWRGVPLAGVPGPYFEPVRARMTDLRADTAEIQAATQAESGNHLAAIATLRALVTAYPLRESVHELLMLALCRAGRQADALEVYDSARRILRDELGIEPGPSLKRMQQRVLSADEALVPGAADARPCGGRRGRPGLPPAAPRRRPVCTSLIPAQHTGPRAISAVGWQLQAARRRALVGRDGEIAAFKAALDDTGRPFTLLFVTGPGGIGKTSLLRRFAQEAQAADRTVVELDGSTGECTAAAFEADASRVLARDRTVLIVDAFDQYRPIDTWLREAFLPRLGLGSIVVLAVRGRPAPDWHSDPAWHEVLRVMRLGELSRRDAAGLLAARQVPEERHEAVLAFAGGNPLALVVAAEAARRDAGDPGDPGDACDPGDAGAEPDWTPPQEVLGSLVPRLVGDAPSPEHRRALDACAVLPTTNEALLRAVLPGPGIDTGVAFAWLRGLPFMESGPHGIRPHDVVRRILAADLRWRDPERHGELVLAAAGAAASGSAKQGAYVGAVDADRAVVQRATC